MPVKCIDCGYLQIVNTVTHSPEAASADYRRDGKLAERIVPGVLGASAIDQVVPQCFKNAVDFASEMTVTAISDQGRREGHRVASLERECRSFTAWVPGYSPKDHDEMLLLEKARAENERLRGKIEALYEVRHQELRKDADKRHDQLRSDAKLWGVVSSIVAILAAVVASLLTRLLSR